MSSKNILLMIALASLWGASFLFMRISVPEFGAVLLVALRVIIAALVLLPFWFLSDSKQARRVALNHWPALMLVGVLNSSVPFVLFAYSMLYVTGGVASILNGTAPIWGAVVAWAWLGSRLSKNAVIGLTLGFIGVVILVGDELAVPSEGKISAIAAAAFAPFLYGIAANYTSKNLNNVSALSIAMFSQAWAGVSLLPFLYWFLPEQNPSAEAWLSLIALAVACTSVAYLMYFKLLADVGSTKAITVTFLIPAFGTLWGAVFIGEEITSMMIIGMAIILLGTALVTGVLKLAKPISENS